MKGRRFRLDFATASGPRAIVWLAIALIPAFALTAAVTRGFRVEQRRLAAEWFDRGETALADHRPEEAVAALRNALTFSREDRTLRLRLAQALMAAGRIAEARAYFLTLYAGQPGSGPVNVELGRLAARDGHVADAIRYYHGAIEGAWRDAAEARRRSARLELIEFLVQRGVEAQAQAELIAIQGDLPPDRDLRLRVAALMAAAGLRDRALSLHEDLARSHPKDPEVLGRAGLAAFETRSYASAVSYLSRAVAAGASDAGVRDALEVSRLVLSLDPFQRRLSTRERALRARRAFEAASSRLGGCPEPVREAHAALEADADAMMPVITRVLPRDPDALESVTDLTFRLVEAARECGELSSVDRALVLLAGQRQGGGR